MATHNQVREIGYLLKDPKILNEGIEGAEKVLFQIRTIHRETEGYYGRSFEDIVIYYDGNENSLMGKVKALHQFDLVDIKGVFNILTVNKRSICPYCGTQNIKYRGCSTFIYPISMSKIGSFLTEYDKDERMPDEILERNFKENSNQALIIGTVVSDPENVIVKGRQYCRYRLGVDRKYYIKTQDEITADYPWVYSCGQQAEWDIVHLVKGAVVLVDGFIRQRQVEATIVCEGCNTEYTYPDTITEFVPYSLEYLSGHKTDEDIAMEAELARRG